MLTAPKNVCALTGHSEGTASRFEGIGRCLNTIYKGVDVLRVLGFSMFFGLQKAVISPLLVLALMSCGSVSPSSTSPIVPPASPFTKTSELPQDGVVELQGTAYIVPFTPDPSIRPASYGAPSKALKSKIFLTFENGEPVAIAGSAGASRFDIDPRLGGEVIVIDELTWYITDDTNPTPHDQAVAYFRTLDPADLDHLTYGAWRDLGGDSRSIGAAHYGSPTTPSDMPVSGSATYLGKGRGIVAFANGGSLLTEFDVTVATSDFRSISIQSTNTEFSKFPYRLDPPLEDPEPYNFTGTGNIDGAGFSANLTSTTGSGTASGCFYGPNAEEVGASFAIDGSGGTHIGAFGASR